MIPYMKQCAVYRRHLDTIASTQLNNTSTQTSTRPGVGTDSHAMAHSKHTHNNHRQSIASRWEFASRLIQNEVEEASASVRLRPRPNVRPPVQTRLATNALLTTQFARFFILGFRRIPLFSTSQPLASCVRKAFQKQTSRHWRYNLISCLQKEAVPISEMKTTLAQFTVGN